MRKILAPLVIALILAGSAYALVYNLFPDNSEFPRVPAWDGTIGGAISLMLGRVDLASYVWDGTVVNTRTLSWLTATGYLQNKKCGGSDVWVSIGSSGIPNCGMTGTLLTMGTLTGVTGTLTVYKADSSQLLGYNGLPLNPWDILSTDASSSGTIAFYDASIIRLDELTTVELSNTGVNSGGQTIAQLILSDGNLWWRVLTSTGINFEAEGYIAWVRWTSISVEKSGSSALFAIIDSIIWDNTAVEIKDQYNNTITQLSSGSLFTIYGGTIGSFIPWKNSLLSGSTWRWVNTVEDMEHLLYAQNNAQSVIYESLTPAEQVEIQAKAQNELYATMPVMDDNEMCISITNDRSRCITRSPTTIPEFESDPNNNLTPDQKLARREFQANDIICSGKYRQVYWPTKSSCIPEWIIWIADFETTPNPEYVSLPAWAQTIKDMNINLVSAGIAPLKWKDFVIDAATEEEIMSWALFDNWYFKTRTIYTGDIPTRWRNPIKNTDTANWWMLVNANYSEIWPWMGQYSSVFVQNATDGWEMITSAGQSILAWNGWKLFHYPKVYKRKALPAVTSKTITLQWQYISYPLSEIGSLAGKTVTIELANPFSSQTCVSSKCYIANFGTVQYFIAQNYNCNGDSVSGYTLCKVGITSDLSDVTGKTTIDLVLPTSPLPTQFLIWNILASTSANRPLMNTIKRILIKNFNL